MKQRGMKYDNSIDIYPIKEGEVYTLPNGSKMRLLDIVKDEWPSYLKEADCVFIDPAGNKGVLKSYYTKADLVCPVDDFKDFASYIKGMIQFINPSRLFMEVFSSNKNTLIPLAEELFPCVKVYESMYYHRPECKCWIVQGTQTPEDYHYDGIDEWDIVMRMSKDVPFDTIADFFMGQGLVAQSAFKAGKRFFGSDMNRNRLAVGIHKVADLGGVWSIK